MKLPPVTVVRIDPFEQTVTAVTWPGKANYTSNLYAMTKAKTLGHFEICKIEERRLIAVKDGLTCDGGPMPLMVAADADIKATIDMPGWKLRDHKAVTAGRAVLFGKGNSGMVDCPVDAVWVEEQIVWLTAEEARDPEGETLTQ